MSEKAVFVTILLLANALMKKKYMLKRELTCLDLVFSWWRRKASDYVIIFK